MAWRGGQLVCPRVAGLCLGMAVAVGMTGCATTGNPYEDTLFFSPSKAKVRLAMQRQRMKDLEAEQSAQVKAQKATQELLAEKGSEVARKEAQLETLRTEIRKKQNAIATLDAKILDAQADPEKSVAALMEERRVLRAELASLQNLREKMEAGRDL